jgi:phytoene/squalene synthetase
VSKTGGSELTAYSRCAQRSAAKVITAYSTSFGMASRLLHRRYRSHVANIYALVRVADELVDGAAAQAGVSAGTQRRLLDELEAEVHRAISDGYSVNLVVHAFACTARAAGIRRDLIAPFFASMRRDLTADALDGDEVRDYIYGSAEVVGLMCLRVFLRDEHRDPEARRRLEEGARRLGAAFQKVNFLRDLSADWTGLGRNYFPSVRPDALTEAQKQALLSDIDDDLAAAAAVIPELPSGCRAAVAAAHQLFAALSRRLRSTPADELLRTRVRVPAGAKAGILVRSALGRVDAVGRADRSAA